MATRIVTVVRSSSTKQRWRTGWSCFSRQFVSPSRTYEIFGLENIFLELESEEDTARTSDYGGIDTALLQSRVEKGPQGDRRETGLIETGAKRLGAVCQEGLGEVHVSDGLYLFRLYQGRVERHQGVGHGDY